MTRYARGYRQGRRDQRRRARGRSEGRFWGRALVVTVGALLFLHWAQQAGLVHP